MKINLVINTNQKARNKPRKGNFNEVDCMIEELKIPEGRGRGGFRIQHQAKILIIDTSP